MKKVNVYKPVLVSNKERAKENRRFFDKMKSLVINIISSPGAGKTSFIQKVAEHFSGNYRILVIEGDIRGQVDSERLSSLPITVLQINTQTECHLDAFMIAQVLPQIQDNYDLIIVENVGNLVCPAEFEIGEDFKLAILSTPEGNDKPLKYPLLFHLAKTVLINKTDLIPYVDFNLDEACRAVTRENTKARIFPVSVKTGDGMEEVYKWIQQELDDKKKNKR